MSSLLERIKKELENELIRKVTAPIQIENVKKEEKSIEKVILEEVDEDVNDEKDQESKSESETNVTSINKEHIEEHNENMDMNTEDEIEQKYTKVLKKYFGYSKFRPMQMKVIKNIIECKKDQLVVMATGFGKSLCYQFPSLFLNGITIVISPLISLMQDQIKALNKRGIGADLLGSSQTESAKSIKEKVFNGSIKILYLTPEYIANDFDILIEFNNKVGIDLVAVDEAHCVSQWGKDFRSSYRKIGKVRNKLKKVPFVALTATATPTVRDDILDSLHLKDPIIIVSSLDRPNLYISVGKKTGSPLEDLKAAMIETHENRLGYKFDGPAIIYCQLKAECENIKVSLRQVGIKAETYHAGMEIEKRRTVQNDFMVDKVDVIVATVAFGMGLDKSNVRNVVHYGCPKDMESYYQEIGRAGRDGLPSKCAVFYSTEDYATIRYFLGRVKNIKHLKYRNRMFSKLRKFLALEHACRRQYLLTHFDKEEDEEEVKNDKKDFASDDEFENEEEDDDLESNYDKSKEDTSKDVVRPNCCDNCTNRLMFSPNKDKYANNKSLTSIVMDKKSFTIITKLKSKKNTKESKGLETVEMVEEEVELIAKPLIKKNKKSKPIAEGNKIVEENKNEQEKNDEEEKRSSPAKVKPPVLSQSSVAENNRFKYKMNLNLNFDFDKPSNNSNNSKSKPSTPTINNNNKKEETDKSVKSSLLFSLNDKPSPNKSNEPLSSISSNMKKYSNPFSWKLSSPGDCINPSLKNKSSVNKINHNLKRSRTIDSDEDEDNNRLENENNNFAKRSKL